MVPLATSGSRADFSQSSPPVGAFDEPLAGAAAAGAGVVAGAVVVVGSPPLAAVVSVVSDVGLVIGSVTAPVSTEAELSLPVVTSAIRVLARVVPVSARPATPPPSSPAVRP